MYGTSWVGDNRRPTRRRFDKNQPEPAPHTVQLTMRVGMTKSDELLSEREDDSLRPAVANRPDRQDDRGNLCNSHAAAACCRRLSARSLRRYFFCCLLKGGLFRIVRFRIAAQLREFVLDHGGLVL